MLIVVVWHFVTGRRGPVDAYIRMGKKIESAVDVEWLDKEFVDTSDDPVAEPVNNREEQITVITIDEHLCSLWTEL